MNILFVMEQAFSPFSGGVQKTTYKLGKHFSERGFQVSYYSTARIGHTTPEYGKLYYCDSESAQSPYDVSYVRGVLDEVQPDIVINQSPYTQEIRLVFSSLKDVYKYRFLGCLRNSLFSFKSNAEHKVKEQTSGFIQKLAISPPGMMAVHLYHYLKHRRDLKRIIDAHDFFILLAPPNRTELEHFVGNYKREKVRAIPNSIPEVHGYKNKRKQMLYVGRLNISQKRTDLLVPVWRELYGQLPDWEFVIVGDGPYKETIDRQIQEENLPRITTVGRQNPHSYYIDSAIFVMPSAYEGFPNVILEAQSYGVVPVAFNSYMALPWIVNDQEDALLVEAFNVKEMAEKIKLLAGSENILQKMAAASNQNAGKFTIDRVGEQWFEFFDEILTHEREE
jgi:glycosyltransferase involved in cell wall biosynthesis